MLSRDAMRRNVLLKRLAAAAILCVLLAGAAVAGVELALRFAGLGDPVVYYTNLTYRFAPMPDQRVVRPGGKVVTINHQGLRATRPWSAPADLRILFIGDSVTWGTSAVSDADTFGERTCALVGTALQLRAVCGNAGVNAYGTDNVTQRILHGGNDDEDWLVVVILSRDAIRSLPTIGAGPYFLVKPSGPLRTTWETLTYAAVRLAFLLRGENERESPDHALLVARDSMHRLLRVLRDQQRGGRRVLVALTVGREAIERPGLPFLDLAPVIRNNFRRGLFLDATHLSPDGNQLVAEAIAARIVAAERAARAGRSAAPAGAR